VEQYFVPEEDGLKAWEGTKEKFQDRQSMDYNFVYSSIYSESLKKRVERVRLRAELVRMYFSLILSFIHNDFTIQDTMDKVLLSRHKTSNKTII
jgi:hypothetical protein